MNPKSIRWKQRLQNFNKAFETLKMGVDIEYPNKLEQQGIIQSFEFTFELAWKTMKDYLESKEVQVGFPRDVIKQAFHYEIIKNGELWMEMLEQRNLMSHTYNEQTAQLALQKIRQAYYQAINDVLTFFKSAE